MLDLAASLTYLLRRETLSTPYKRQGRSHLHSHDHIIHDAHERVLDLWETGHDRYARLAPVPGDHFKPNIEKRRAP